MKYSVDTTSKDLEGEKLDHIPSTEILYREEARKRRKVLRQVL